MTDDKLWNILSKHDLDTDIMTAGTSCADKSVVGDQDCNTPQGLAANHAYTVLGVASITKNGEEVRLVKVRNPWGDNQYKGPWSEESGDWTAELKAEVDEKLGGVGHGDAGVFYMDITTYRNNFEGTSINEDVSGWDLSYFLMLGDTKTETKADDFGFCSACTEHIMEVKNPSNES